MDAAAVRIDKVLFLGTGGAVPVPGARNMSSLAVVLTSGASIIVDCGEGTQHQIRVSSHVRSSRIEVVLLTHLHGDHSYGLFGLLHTIAMEGRREPLLLVGPEGLQTMVETILRCSGGWFPETSFELQYLEIPNHGMEGQENLVGSDGFGPSKQGFNPELAAQARPVSLGTRAGISMQAVPLVHSVPDWGYILTEPGRPGALDVERAIALGVPKGPLLGKLKKGQEIQLADGTVVHPSQVLGPPVLGRTIAVLQDTCDSRSAIAPCMEADCIIHECTFEESMVVEAISKGHSTSAMAAKFALACKAKRLVLTHFSARYSSSSVTSRSDDPAHKLGLEASRILGDQVPVVVAQDFMVLRGGQGFDPAPELALKRCSPWIRPEPLESVGKKRKSPAPCCGDS